MEEVEKYILPELANIVYAYCAEWVLLDWINPDKIIWNYLSQNTNDGAIELLKANPDKIIWCELSGNSNDSVIELLKANPDKIDWRHLSRNPGILKLNTHKR